MDAQRQAELGEVARKLVAGTLWPEPMTAYLVALDFCRDREEGQFLRGVIASLKAGSAQQEEAMAAETLPPSTSSTTPSPATEKPFESLRRAKSEGRRKAPLVAWMQDMGVPVTREKYLALAYPDGLPEEWTAELEAQLPQELQQPFPK